MGAVPRAVSRSSRTAGETSVACSEISGGAVPISYGSYRCDQRRQVGRKLGETVKAERLEWQGT